MNNWDLEKILNALSNLSEDTIPQWGTMSAQRMVEHLTDTIRIATGKNPQTLLTPVEKLDRMKAFLLSDKPMARNIDVPFAPKKWSLRNDELDLAIDELTDEWINFEEFFFSEPNKTTCHAFYGELNYDLWRKLNDKHIQHHFEQFGLISQEE